MVVLAIEVHPLSNEDRDGSAVNYSDEPLSA